MVKWPFVLGPALTAPHQCKGCPVGCVRAWPFARPRAGSVERAGPRVDCRCIHNRGRYAWRAPRTDRGAAPRAGRAGRPRARDARGRTAVAGPRRQSPVGVSEASAPEWSLVTCAGAPPVGAVRCVQLAGRSRPAGPGWIARRRLMPRVALRLVLSRGWYEGGLASRLGARRIRCAGDGHAAERKASTHAGARLRACAYARWRRALACDGSLMRACCQMRLPFAC